MLPVKKSRLGPRSSILPYGTSFEIENFLNFCDEDRLYASIMGRLAETFLPSTSRVNWIDVGAASGRKSVAMAWSMRDRIKFADLVENDRSQISSLQATIVRDFPAEISPEISNFCISKFQPKRGIGLVTAIHYAYHKDAVNLLFNSPALASEIFLFVASVEHESSPTAAIRRRILRTFARESTIGYPEQLEASTQAHFSTTEKFVIGGKTLDLRSQKVDETHWFPRFLIGPSWAELKQDAYLCSEISMLIESYLDENGRTLELRDSVFIGRR